VAAPFLLFPCAHPMFEIDEVMGLGKIVGALVERKIMHPVTQSLDNAADSLIRRIGLAHLGVARLVRVLSRAWDRRAQLLQGPRASGLLVTCWICATRVQ
jgi:hypothetical protein